MENNKKILEEILIKENITEHDEEIIFRIIPEIMDEKGFKQNNPWHIYDVWNHTKQLSKIQNPIKK